MAVVTDRIKVLELLDRTREAKAVMPLFCAANTYEVQANLEAVRQFALENNIKNPPVGISVTFEYESMQQARRFISPLGGETGEMAVKRSEAGLRMLFSTLNILCGVGGSMYADVMAVPHLDHADAEREEQVWKDYSLALGTVMVDASLGDRTLEENIALTSRMVERYGSRLVIEGALQRPAVEGHHEAGAVEDDAAYARSAKDYVDQTGVDMIVVELGSSQQALGWARYNSERSRAVTKELGKAMMVLHGGSSIPLEQQRTLGDDGVLRFNQWTRTAREGAMAAAEAIFSGMDVIKAGDSSQAYMTRYTDAHFNQQVKTLKAVLEALNYQRYAV